jgi:hypothetical protein
MVVLALLAAPAGAQTPEVLEPVGAQTVVSAYGGHAVWNELDVASGRWYLRHRFAGTSARLPVRSRSVQFDVDVGPLGHGQIAADDRGRL